MRSSSLVCHLAVDKDSENKAFVSYWAAAKICDDPTIMEGESLDELMEAIIYNNISSVYFHDFDFESTYIIDWLFKN